MYFTENNCSYRYDQTSRRAEQSLLLREMTEFIIELRKIGYLRWKTDKQAKIYNFRQFMGYFYFGIILDQLY